MFLDLWLQSESGFNLLPEILRRQPGIGVIVITAFATFESAVEAMKMGAVDYLRPFTPEQVRSAARRVVTANILKRQLGEFRDRLGQAENSPFPANMSKRNAFRGPGLWNLDAALYKNFRVAEGKQIQLRFEAYNVFNHANLFVSGGEAEVSNGFVPAFFDGRRNVQIAGKFIF